jgi:hypothetical protein
VLSIKYKITTIIDKTQQWNIKLQPL